VSVLRYVAIITDGNGRWAQQRGLPVIEGHRAGADVVKERLRDAAELGIEELTVFSFSTENWSRSEEEVSGLMRMFGERIASETPELDEEGVRMRFVGRREGVDPGLVERMEWAERTTARNERISLFVAFNYGGRAEIVDAARTFQGSSEEEFRRHLYAPEMHDPDLLIRTSGEQRISNFLLWQTAYSELVVRDELWPDFDRAAFEGMMRSQSEGFDDEAIAHYWKAFESEDGRRGVLELYRSGDFSKLEAYEGRLTALDLPMLALWGENDPFAPVAGAYRFRKELPDTEIVVVDGSGHFVFADDPERCAREVARFLSGLD